MNTTGFKIHNEMLESAISQVEDYPHSWPNSTEPEVGRMLASLFKMCGYKSFLEMGTYRGLTTLQLMKVAWGSVTSIDVEDARHPVMKSGFVEGGYRFILGDSRKDVPEGEKFDMVFIDTMHTYDHTLAEIFVASDFLNPGGLIALHDAISCPDVQRAVDDSCRRFGWRTLTLPTVHHGIASQGRPMSGLAIISLMR